MMVPNLPTAAVLSTVLQGSSLSYSNPSSKLPIDQTSLNDLTGLSYPPPSPFKQYMSGLTGYIYQPMASKYSIAPVAAPSVLALSSSPAAQPVLAPLTALVSATPTRKYVMPAIGNPLNIPTESYLAATKSEIPTSATTTSARRSYKLNIFRGNPYAGNGDQRRKYPLKSYKSSSPYAGAYPNTKTSINYNRNVRKLYKTLLLKKNNGSSGNGPDTRPVLRTPPYINSAIRTQLNSQQKLGSENYSRTAPLGRYLKLLP